MKFQKWNIYSVLIFLIFVEGNPIEETFTSDQDCLGRVKAQFKLTCAQIQDLCKFSNDGSDNVNLCTEGSPAGLASCCLQTFGDIRIVGGTSADPHSVPFQAGITWAPSGTKPFCGGSLISPTFVLTAAHCAISRTAPAIRVILGDHDFTVSDGELNFPVKNRLIHPWYDRNLQIFDLALLELESPVLLPSSNIGLVCLPPKDAGDFNGWNLTASGWGTTSARGKQSLTLKVGMVVGVSNTVCKTKIPVSDQHLCAAFDHTDACQGDSGGPLTAIVRSKVTLVGVTSFGKGCAEPGFPGVYVRVTQLMDWILDNSDAGNFTCFPDLPTEKPLLPALMKSGIPQVVAVSDPVSQACPTVGPSTANKIKSSPSIGPQVCWKELNNRVTIRLIEGPARTLGRGFDQARRTVETTLDANSAESTWNLDKIGNDDNPYFRIKNARTSEFLFSDLQQDSSGIRRVFLQVGANARPIGISSDWEIICLVNGFVIRNRRNSEFLSITKNLVRTQPSFDGLGNSGLWTLESV